VSYEGPASRGADRAAPTDDGARVNSVEPTSARAAAGRRAPVDNGPRRGPRE
jgi:hypothetical protein